VTQCIGPQCVSEVGREFLSLKQHCKNAYALKQIFDRIAENQNDVQVSRI